MRALTTGLGFLPHTLVGIACARLAPAVMRRTGARAPIVLSALLAAAGFAWQSRIGAGSCYTDGLLGHAIVMSPAWSYSSRRSPPPSPHVSTRGTPIPPPG